MWKEVLDTVLLIRNAKVYSPDFLGVRDVFVAGGKICCIRERIDVEDCLPVEVIDGKGCVLLPGFIDNHVHILGGGGEGGYRTRTPELSLSTMIEAGVTTVVGCIGTDGVTRRMENLVAKAKGLKEEGVSCFIYTGSYDVPVRTLLGDIRTDMLMIEEVIGVGEIAVADHRSSLPTLEELSRILSDARVGGMLSGKAGIVNVHLGDGAQMLDLLEEIKEKTPLPTYHFVPTHMNRNPELFERGIDYAKNGGNVDFTTSSFTAFTDLGEIKCSKSLRRMLDAGVPVARMTFSSDGQGSLPVFNSAGEMTGLQVGKMNSLFAEVKDAVMEENIPLETAIRVITSNDADLLKLPQKGRIREGNDADLVLADENSLAIQTVISLGQVMMREGEIVVKGTFE